MTRSIYIFCNGGFGNRFLSLISGRILGSRLGLEPRIVWPRNNWCDIDFHEIFDGPGYVSGNFPYTDLVGAGKTLNILHENHFGKHIAYYKSKLPLAFLKLISWVGNKDVFFATNRLERYARRTEFLEPILRSIVFRRELIDRADLITNPILKRFPSFKSLHIRRTDFPRQVETSKYFEIVKSRPEEMFFVCSDDSETEEYFSRFSNVFVNRKSHYVKRLLDGGWCREINDENETSFPFNVNRTKDSVLASIVDLIILSRGDLSLNPRSQSSFLNVASLLSHYRVDS
jgi:hypothetical protein